jgi:aminomethyltransferase
VTPYDAGLGRVVKFDKPDGFVGAEALGERAHAAPRRILAGLTVRSRRVPRHGYTVLADGTGCGTVTSGAPSPTLGVPIALAYLDPQALDTKPALAVDIRGRAEPAEVTDLPFYRRRH